MSGGAQVTVTLAVALEIMPALDETANVPKPCASTALVNVATLSEDFNYPLAYSICVHGSRVFCGLHSGHIQHIQCPLNAPPTMQDGPAAPALLS